MSDTPVLISTAGRVGRITLNRPKALNALNLDMVRAIFAALNAWRADDSVQAVVIDGAGEKAFCAGGDIRALYDGVKSDPGAASAFWAEEYVLNAAIRDYPKPYVALIDGITMGGGVGLSIHGAFRVATERTLFAMPETMIGFYPDVGATYVLPRFPGRTGYWMALTGARLSGADCLALGAATHFILSDRSADVITALETGDFDADGGELDALLHQFETDPGPADVDAHRAVIDSCFDHDTVEAILDALALEGSEWALAQREELLGKSPSALKVTLRALLRGEGLDFAGAMAVERSLSASYLADGGDFVEGVRALIVDKDHSPHWSPAALQDVTDAMVEARFQTAPLGEA